MKTKADILETIELTRHEKKIRSEWYSNDYESGEFDGWISALKWVLESEVINAPQKEEEEIQQDIPWLRG